MKGGPVTPASLSSIGADRNRNGLIYYINDGTGVFTFADV